MEAKDRPLTEEERRERERAREMGKQMARDTIKKLEPQIKAIADVINEANDRIYEDGRKAGIREVVEWIRAEILRYSIIDNADVYNKLQAKLKEWGIE